MEHGAGQVRVHQLRAAKVGALQVQSELHLPFQRHLQPGARADCLHYGLNVLTDSQQGTWFNGCPPRFEALVPGGKAHKGTQQSHNPQMVLLRVFLGEPLERVNAAQAHRQDLAAQHFRSLLVALIQQSLLRRFGLTLCRRSLALQQHPAPYGEHQCKKTGDQKTEISYRRAVRFSVRLAPHLPRRRNQSHPAKARPKGCCKPSSTTATSTSQNAVEFGRFLIRPHHR